LRKIKGGLWAAWFLLILIGPAIASVDLPVSHWAYKALRRLSASGFIDQSLLNTQPISRRYAAKLVAQAQENLKKRPSSDKNGTFFIEALMGRLQEEFQEELNVLRNPMNERGLRYRISDPLEIELGGTSLKGGRSLLRENHEGDRFFEGLNLQLINRSWLEVGPHLSVLFRPKLIKNQENWDSTFPELSGKISFWNVNLDVGRAPLWWDPGVHGAMLLSNNAFPFERILLQNEEPFRMPGSLKRLGIWNIKWFLGQLEKDRDFPHTKLSGLRFSVAPAPWLEVGALRVTQFGGDGRPALEVEDYFDIYFGNPNQSGKLDVNELASIDGRLRFTGLPSWFPPGENLELYVEVAGEDEAGYLPSRNGYLSGVYFPDLFRMGRIDLTIEYAQNHVPGYPLYWYNVNHIYSDGYTFKRNVIGHHMGSDAHDFWLHLGYLVNEQFQVEMGLERVNALGAVPDRIEQIKTRLETTVRYDLSRRLSVSGQYEYLSTRNDQFLAGLNRGDHLVLITLSTAF
jgi:hypothetical protein